MYPTTNFEYFEFLTSVSAYWSERTSDSLISLTPFGYTSGYLLVESMDMKISTGIAKGKIRFNLFEKPFYGFPDSTLYKSMTIADTTLYGSVTTQTYLTHPVYRNFPVLNINPNQAATYCKWRTDMVKLNYACKIRDSTDYLKYVEINKYRLPSKQEWFSARDKANLDYSIHEDNLLKGSDPIVNIFYFTKNKYKFDFYDFPNYLSEIIDSNQIINYSWKDSIMENSELVRPFKNISPGTGFRCACEVKK